MKVKEDLAMPVRFRWEKNFKDTEIGRIPKDWKVRRIGEIGKVITGKTPPTKEKQYWNGNIPFITPSDIPDYDIRYDYKVERFVSKKWLYKAKNLLIPKNSPCFVCIGSTIGKVCLTRENSFTNQQINSIIPKKDFDYMFIFYNLRANQFRIRDEYGGGGAAKDIISKSKFEKVILPFPNNHEEQSRIATVLSWFDELIEVKKKQNEILEKTAMAIFKSWFIDFEPFKDEEFVYSEELGREIPKGWEVKRLEEIAYIIRGISFKAEIANFEPFYNSVPILRANNIRKSWEIDFSNLMFIPKQKVKKHQILKEKDFVMVASNGNPKLVGKFSLFIPLISKTSFSVGAFMYIVRPKLPEYVYLYCLLKSLYFQEFLESIISGTNINNLKKADLENFMFVFPPSYILTKFHSLVQPLFEKIINNQKEIMILKKVRDTLLPLLVFGKLRVEEI